MHNITLLSNGLQLSLLRKCIGRHTTQQLLISLKKNEKCLIYIFKVLWNKIYLFNVKTKRRRRKRKVYRGFLRQHYNTTRASILRVLLVRKDFTFGNVWLLTYLTGLNNDEFGCPYFTQASSSWRQQTMK